VLGAKAYDRRRKFALAAVFALLAVGLILEARSVGATSAGELFRALAQSPIVQILLTPLSWFVEAFTAEDAWHLVKGGCLSALVNLGLLVLVLGLDAHYLESAAVASERVYAKLQRLRVGGAAAAWGTSGKPRFSLPALPLWGGIGPMAWRQLISASRGMKGLIVFLIFLGVIMGTPFFFAIDSLPAEQPDGGAGEGPDSQAATKREAVLIGLAGTLIGISLFTLPMMLTFDFRGDVDRIDILKSLPVQAWRLTVGQLLTPVLITTTIQVVLLGACQVLWGGMELLLLGAVCFALPVNFLLFGIENLMFLWFPTRMAGATPGDFQAMGRYMLLFMAKMLIMGVTLGVAWGVAAKTYLISDNYYVAGAASWPVVAVAAAALVPLIAYAFRRFDVARDVPA
jgi:hypothetical protein